MFARIVALTLLCALTLGQPAWADPEAAKETCRQGSERELNGDDDGALRYYHAALGQDPEYSEAWRMIGYLEGRRKNYKDALAALDQYLQAEMADMKVRHYADSLREEYEGRSDKRSEGRRQEVAEAEEPANREPAADDPLQQGQEMERAGDFAEALIAYQAALAVNAHVFEAWRGVGNCQAHLGHRQEALRAYDKYLGAHPEDKEVSAYALSLREQRKSAKSMQRHMQAQMKMMQEMGAMADPSGEAEK